ncbi:inorganic diphosphatase, partial [Patescibacteria group bacterium]|nr:inorganic diphosphatase [Patescibacteria group bacterium]
MKKHNLFHIVPKGDRFPSEVNCIVEIAKGGKNKYEYDHHAGFFKLDRVLYEAVYYPTEYGIIPQTWNTKDEDPLDVMVLSSFSTFPGCVISCKPIGMIKIDDTGEEDNKIIAVPADDPRFSDIKDLDDMPAHSKKEIENFWTNYSELQPDKKIIIKGWSEKKAALEEIRVAAENYKRKFTKNK